MDRNGTQKTVTVPIKNKRANMHSDILDDHGKPIPRESWRIIQICKCVGRSWRTWVPILISLGALGISIWSVYVSSKNSDVTQRLSKLDFRPRLRLNTLFKSVGNTPPHWQLTNMGPVEAVQVQVKIFAHRRVSYKTGETKIGMSLYDSSNKTTIPSIIPQETKLFQFNKGWLDGNARIQKPPQHNVMEIMVIYRHPQDLEEYSESAYYFVDPDGHWVHETSSSLKGEPYESMKKELLEMNREVPFSIYQEFGGDRLHPNK